MRIPALALILLATSPSVALIHAQDWTRFRGPNGAGISDATTIPSAWTEKDYNWVVTLPGAGHSSPVVWGDRVFVTASNAETGTRSLLCLDAASGKVVWKHDVTFKAYRKHKNNSFASSTPCVDEKHVYVVWHSRESSPLLALDHQGNEVWTYELGPYTHGQGGATSPIVYEDLVILAHDQKQPSFLLAVDRHTGKERWKTDREGKRACYATPCIFKPKDHSPEIIFTHCYEGIVGVDPATGDQKWHIDVFGRTPQRALGSPVLADELIIATSGAVGGERQLVAVKPQHKPGDGDVKEVWRTVRQTPHVPTPLVYKDRLFMWSDQGIVSCLSTTTGETIWQKRVGGNFFSSPVCVDGRLFCIDVDGNVIVLAAGDQFVKLGETALGEGSKATPAISGGVMYLRTETKLYSLGGSL